MIPSSWKPRRARVYAAWIFAAVCLISPLAVVAAPAADTIELDVNTLTGDVKLVGNSISMATYEITSDSGAPDSSRWNSLANQGLGDFLAFTTSDIDLSEGSLDVNTVNFTGVQSYDIATGASGLFRANATQDIVFTYLDGDNNFATGAISYLPGVSSLPEPMLVMMIVPVLLLGRRRVQ